MSPISPLTFHTHFLTKPQNLWLINDEVICAEVVCATNFCVWKWSSLEVLMVSAFYALVGCPSQWPHNQQLRDVEDYLNNKCDLHGSICEAMTWLWHLNSDVIIFFSCWWNFAIRSLDSSMHIYLPFDVLSIHLLLFIHIKILNPNWGTLCLFCTNALNFVFLLCPISLLFVCSLFAFCRYALCKRGTRRRCTPWSTWTNSSA